MQTPAPSVSAIICTRDRTASFRRALASVLAQDLLPDEIIVVDGSIPPAEVPNTGPIPLRLIHDERAGEGAARAAGLRAAQGDLIAWCDDDDQWTPDHLRILCEPLLSRPDLSLVAAGGGPRAERTRLNLSHAVSLPAEFFIPAGDVMHRAAAARAVGGFDPELPAWAAGDLWARIALIGECAQIEQFVTTHDRLSGGLDAASRTVVLKQVFEKFATTLRSIEASHARMSHRVGHIVPFDPSTWREGRRELIFQTQMKGWVSYPVVAKGLTRALQRLNVRVTLGPHREGRLSPEWNAICGPAEPQNRLGLTLDSRFGPASLRCERSVFLFMWETTRLRRYEVDEINGSATMLYVPCLENARIARENGITVPVRILPFGIDPERTPYLERPRTDSEMFTFGTTSSLGRRKGTDLLVRAFREEFVPHEPVRLILRHTYHDYPDDVPDDPRIVVITSFFHDGAFNDFLRGLDAYVLPSRGEGFGLTAIEAMASGLPTIATDWNGPHDYLDPADSYPLRFTMAHVGEPSVDHGAIGCWAEPDIAHLRELMRYLYQHREEAAAAGRRSSARILRDWTWERPARQLVADFDLLAAGATPVSSFG